MEDAKSGAGEKRDRGGKLVIVFLALLFIVLVMTASIYYPFPGGKTSGVGGFIALWFREILFVGLGAVVLILIGGAWLRRVIRKLFAGRSDAP